MGKTLELNNTVENQILADSEQNSFTTEELAEFLAEISAEDEELSNTEILAAFEINETRDSDNDKMPSIISELIKDDNENEIGKKISSALKKHNEEKKQKQLEITRLAFNQSLFPLNSKLTNEHKKKLIELLTEPIRKLIDKYSNFINTRIEKLIFPIIPHTLKIAYKKWPHAFIKHPGFLYRTHAELGPIETFYAIPNIPYYFEQGREQKILEERDAYLTPYYLNSLDRTVHRWHRAKETLADREVKYALRLVRIKKNTFYHLLLLNPIWFEKLFIYLKNENDKLAKPLL